MDYHSRRVALTFAIAACSGVAGCAGTEYHTVQATASDDSTDGIRYYDPAPFVLVYTDGKGGLNSSLIYLPDTTQKRVIKPYAVVAKNEASFSFDKGILTSAKNIVDETILPAAVLDAATQIATEALKNADTAGPVSSEAQIPPPALFRVFVASDGSIRLRGSYGADENGATREINITIVPQPKKDDAGAEDKKNDQTQGAAKS